MMEWHPFVLYKGLFLTNYCFLQFLYLETSLIPSIDNFVE